MFPFDPNRTVFLFPGQGSQRVGMGRSLAEAYPIATETFAEADEVLGAPLSRLMWDGPADALNDTVNAQPALLTHSVAAWRVLKHLWPEADAAFLAGHSLGELSALVAAEALPFTDALRLVRRRGELMKQAGEESPGGMAAVLGLEAPTLEALCAEVSTEQARVQIANDNCPGQIVVSGHRPALEALMTRAREAGAKRVIPLAVSIAAHSTLMESARAAFAQAVDAAPIRNPRTPIIGNVSAQPLTTAEAIRADLKAQLTARVRWTESIQFLRAQGVEAFLELGSGNVLCGLLRRIDRRARGVPLGEADDFQKLL